jgi:hypothetical protein
MSVGDRMEAVGNLTEEGHSAREISEENLTSRRPLPSKADRRAVKEAELAGGRRARAGGRAAAAEKLRRPALAYGLVDVDSVQ